MISGNSGYCRIELRQFSQALSDYEKATELNSAFAEGWEGVGRCLYELGRIDEAVNAWRQALKINPDLMWSNNNIGWVLLDRGKKYEESLKWFDRAIKIEPNQSVPIVNKAKALVALNRVSEAQALLEGALKEACAGDKRDNLVRLAGAFSELFNDAQKALELCEQAVKLGAAGPDLELNIAEMLIRLDRREEGRGRASGVLEGDSEPRLKTVAAFLLYASHALEGDLAAADHCFADFAERIAELARAGGPGQAGVGWTYDGFLDMVVKCQASLATKFTLAAAIDLQNGQLGALGLSRLHQFLPLIQRPASGPAVVASAAA
jgi:tetratricopeptide (TPR) repeat protein